MKPNHNWSDIPRYLFGNSAKVIVLTLIAQKRLGIDTNIFLEKYQERVILGDRWTQLLCKKSATLLDHNTSHAL